MVKLSKLDLLFRIHILPKIGFTTAKKVKLLDWRLGLFYYGLIGVVVLYVFWAVLQAAEYLESSIPSAEFTSYALESDPTGRDTAGTNYEEYQGAFYDLHARAGFNSSHSFCNNPEYDFEDTSGFTYVDMPCAYVPSAQISLKDGKNLFFTSAAYNQDTFYYKVLEGGRCDRAGFESIPEIPNCELNVYKEPKLQGGRCYCRRAVTRLYVGVENMTTIVAHTYNSKHWSGTLPKTHVRRDGDDKDYAVFEVGEDISLPLWKILEIAGVNLDERNDGVANGTDFRGSTASPHFRVTGTKIYMKFLYVNYKDNEDDQFDPDVVAYLSIKASKVWESRGNDVVFTGSANLREQEDDLNKAYGYMSNTYRYGISLNFESMGTVYTFSLTVLITAVVQGLVMLGVCETIVAFIATHNPLSIKTSVYKEVVETQFDIFRETAKFAAKALIAGEVYDMMDKNRDTEVTAREMELKVRKVFLTADALKNMSREDQQNMEVLTQFIFAEMDVSRQTKEEMLLEQKAILKKDPTKNLDHPKKKNAGDADGKITKREWVDLVSAGESNMDTVLKLVTDLDAVKREMFLQQYRRACESLKLGSDATTTGDTFYDLPPQSALGGDLGLQYDVTGAL